MEPPDSASTLKTLLQVWGDGSLPPSVVHEVYQSEGKDMKLCCEVLWELTPQVGVPIWCCWPIPRLLEGSIVDGRSGEGWWMQFGYMWCVPRGVLAANCSRRPGRARAAAHAALLLPCLQLVGAAEQPPLRTPRAGRAPDI